MPWTAADAEKHNKHLSAHQRTIWASAANAALADCQKKGGEDCEGRAIRIANAAVRKVAKAEDRGLVYGWANVLVKDGSTVVDSQGDMIDPAEMEMAMVDFMRHHRASGVMHQGDPVGQIVEALVVTPDKLRAMGFPEDVVAQAPTGTWIGVQFDPASPTYQAVKDGRLGMFSIEGTATREDADG